MGLDNTSTLGVLFLCPQKGGISEVLLMENKPKKEVKLRIDEELHHWFKQQSKSRDRSMNNLIIQALKYFKQHQEI